MIVYCSAPGRGHQCRPPGRWRRWWGKLGIGSVYRCECGDEWAFVRIPRGVSVGERCWVNPVPSWPDYYPGLDPGALARVQDISPFDERRGEAERMSA